MKRAWLIVVAVPVVAVAARAHPARAARPVSRGVGEWPAWWWPRAARERPGARLMPVRSGCGAGKRRRLGPRRCPAPGRRRRRCGRRSAAGTRVIVASRTRDGQNPRQPIEPAPGGDGRRARRGAPGAAGTRFLPFAGHLSILGRGLGGMERRPIVPPTRVKGSSPTLSEVDSPGPFADRRLPDHRGHNGSRGPL